MKTTLIIISFFLIWLSIGCEKEKETKYGVSLENNSAIRLHTITGLPGFGAGGIHPDTSLPVQKPLFSTIHPNSTGYIIYNSSTIEKLFEQLPSDTLNVYLMNADTVDAQNWDVIRNDYKVIRRYSVSLQDLQSSNYKIVYP